MKLDAKEEKEILKSVGRGEWLSVKGMKRDQGRYSRYAKTTLRKVEAEISRKQF
jgi:hypothetical protein